MTLKTIRLELARTPEQPQGDAGHAYEFRAPLTDSGHLDEAAWSAMKELCVVKRLEHGREVESGILQHTRARKWVFSYAPGQNDDEVIFRLSTHTFLVGEYLTITEHDGVQRTFRVASVSSWHPVKSEDINVARWPRR